MPKKLSAIIKSTTTKLKLGDQPGVDYQPKAPAEQDFVAHHDIQKFDDRSGNGDDVFKGTTKYSLDKETKHGHKKPVDSMVYDPVKIKEGAENRRPLRVILEAYRGNT